MMIYIVLFLLILYFYLVSHEKEGFSLVEGEDVLKQKTYQNEKIEDAFYTYNYDDMVLTIPYLIELIQMIQLYLRTEGKTLCLGSKTGHLVQLLSKTTPSVGLDPSKSMVEMSRYKYPGLEYIEGAYLDSSLFPNHAFTQVILPMLTLHTIPDFKALCRTVKDWTIHSGYFFVCFVDIRTFPVYKLVNHHPSEYFSSNYSYMIEFKDHKRIEKITNTEHVTRTNIQDLYEYNEKGIIYDAMGAGFTHVKTLRYQSVPISVCVFQHK
jgi:hypothetical protein